MKDLFKDKKKRLCIILLAGMLLSCRIVYYVISSKPNSYYKNTEQLSELGNETLDIEVGTLEYNAE